MISFDPHHHPYASYRTPTYGKKGMVATSQPLASQIGLDILKKGGNAVDAAVAVAASLTVLEPTSNGIGGDAFALVWMDGDLHGLNASGYAPEALSINGLYKDGYDEMPKRGPVPITVPGAPAAWAELSRAFGKLPFSELIAPAVAYAEEGYPVASTLATLWDSAFETLEKELDPTVFADWSRVFAPDGRTPAAGELWRSKGHAETLKEIADTKAESFYRGNLAKKIDTYMREQGGYLRSKDLALYKPEWVKPISVHYKGYDVWEIPPNGQGIVALMALNILKEHDFQERDSVNTLHHQMEAMKLAFVDGEKYVAQSDAMTRSTEELLSDAYGEARRGEIGNEAKVPEAGDPYGGGTVYLATADGEGNMVSFIQSNYMGFGSGMVVPETGIALHNRAHNFSMDEKHANGLMPGKRPYHTIIPGFLTKGDEPVGPFGVMGEFMQPQGHMQMIMNTIDFGLHPQAALDAPRWQWKRDTLITVEPDFSRAAAQALSRKGHTVKIETESSSFGRGQIIWRDPETGVLCGGSESRTDGNVAAW